jgi:sugar O-acyltransferase (sialic acid O-acetyltransferase NeuD family)
VINFVGVYGSSGFGREVMPLVKGTVSERTRCVFVDDSDSGQCNGYDIVSFDQFTRFGDDVQIAIAIADSGVRENLAEKCRAANIPFYPVIAPNLVMGDAIQLGEGAILCSFVHLTSNVVIGAQFHANIYSYVAHDCVIGDYVTFAPGVKCNGNVHIEDHAYVGTGAILKQGVPGKPLRIGKGAVVGMGAVVTKDVADGATVVGNPARVMER